MDRIMNNRWYKNIKTFDDAYNYLSDKDFKDNEKIQDLLSSYLNCLPGSYEEKVSKLRIIVSSLKFNVPFDNIECAYTPRFTFFSVDEASLKTLKESYNDNYNRYVGVISLLNKNYYVISSIRTISTYLISYSKPTSLHALNSFMTFLNKDVAAHFLKFFVKDIFEVMYGGITDIDFNWKWENL